MRPRKVDYSKPYPREMSASAVRRGWGQIEVHMRRAEHALDCGRLYGPYIERDYAEYHIRMAMINLTGTGPVLNYEKSPLWERMSAILKRMADLTAQQNRTETRTTDTHWNVEN